MFFKKKQIVRGPVITEHEALENAVVAKVGQWLEDNWQTAKFEVNENLQYRAAVIDEGSNVLLLEGGSVLINGESVLSYKSIQEILAKWYNIRERRYLLEAQLADAKAAVAMRTWIAPDAAAIKMETK